MKVVDDPMSTAVTSAHPAVLIMNPLPISLYHYTETLSDILVDAGLRSTVVGGAGIESLGESNVLRRIANLARMARRTNQLLRFDGKSNSVIVTWPSLGYLDILIWRCYFRHASHLYLVIHDVIALRPQFGMQRWVWRFAKYLKGRNMVVLVHNQIAQDLLGGVVSGVWKVPLPIRRSPNMATPSIAGALETSFDEGQCSADQRSHPATRLTVAGQFKPSRVVHLLEEIGASEAFSEIDLRLVGNGWPTIQGWTRVSGFLSEDDFSKEISASTAVLIPYADYNQSGVSVQCLEMGVPVIGVRHPQIFELFGRDYAGVVSELTAENVATALDAAIQTPRSDILRRHRAIRKAAIIKWGQLIKDP